MKNQIALPVSQAKKSRISWLDRKDILFSALLEERVTIRQSLLVMHVLFVFFLFVGAVFTSVLPAILLGAWLGLSVHLMKKGGIR